jgi:4-hydroxybenzoate polyprenyltransferase
MRYAIIEPIAQLIPVKMAGAGLNEFLSLQLPWYDFVVLVFATVCITAGGYVINDYFDIRTDLINRGEVIVGTSIPRRKAMMLHNILNVIGVIAGFWVSYRIGYFWIGITFMLVSGLLYFYSATYKRQLLIGNIIVAVLTALVPLMVAAFEVPAIYKFYSLNAVEVPPVGIIFYWVGGFAVFAFLTNLAREIIKDIEDFEGDKAFGSNSLPVAAGIPASKIVVSVILGLTIFLLLLTWFRYLSDYATLIYLCGFLIIPMIINSIILIRGRTQKQFHKASNIIKIVMLAGIFYSVIAWFILKGRIIL